jgi:hypothetical protein
MAATEALAMGVVERSVALLQRPLLPDRDLTPASERPSRISVLESGHERLTKTGLSMET